MKTCAEMNDEELFDELREHVNLARSAEHRRNRKRTRELAAEMQKRGWGVILRKQHRQPAHE